MVLPGVAVIPPSLLVIARPEVTFNGVVSLAELPVLPLPFPSRMRAVLLIWVVPGGTGLSTVTAKLTVLLVPVARLPALKVQIVPAGLALGQLQVAVLLPKLKLVFAGTVSVMINPVRLDPDRKSTRLNSSHLGISYAVFCLK